MLELHTLWSCNQLYAHNSRTAVLQTTINIALLGQGILICPCCKDTSLLLSCAVSVGITISLCYYWLAAGGSGQEISTDMDSDPLEQPTRTGAARLSVFYKFPLLNFKYGEGPNAPLGSLSCVQGLSRTPQLGKQPFLRCLPLGESCSKMDCSQSDKDSPTPECRHDMERQIPFHW